jgi:hypothetical protein
MLMAGCSMLLANNSYFIVVAQNCCSSFSFLF